MSNGLKPTCVGFACVAKPVLRCVKRVVTKCKFQLILRKTSEFFAIIICNSKKPALFPMALTRKNKARYMGSFNQSYELP